MVAHEIGGAYVTYLNAKRIGVSRDMRVSSPALMDAFVAGARGQGCDVVDYGMQATDMIYFAVVRDGLDGGVQITASHNPKQYNGIKMVRKGAQPLSGDEGHRRDPRHGRGQDDAAEGAARRHADPGQRPRRLHEDGDGLHRPEPDQAVQRRARRRQRHGRPGRAQAVRSAPLQDDAARLHARRDVPELRGQPADRGEPQGRHRAGAAREGRHRHRLGRRRRSRVLHRRQRRVHRRRLHHRAARRGVPDPPAGPGDRLRRARQLRRQGHGRAATTARPT